MRLCHRMVPTAMNVHPATLQTMAANCAMVTLRVNHARRALPHVLLVASAVILAEPSKVVYAQLCVEMTVNLKEGSGNLCANRKHFDGVAGAVVMKIRFEHFCCKTKSNASPRFSSTSTVSMTASLNT